jgi:serine/threonine-protein kinase
MSLTPGARLGVYEVLEQIGEGGMGQVYRARDTKLGRDVAIKVLPRVFAADPERLARFEREARTLASLNHPNIAQIYGTEQIPSTGPGSGQPAYALVIELVGGEDLADRLARGRLPVDEALEIAKHIAGALDAAHELGIVHRDLKPANVKVRPDGAVKVLDFGLAKAVNPIGERSPGNGPQASQNSPTFTSPVVTQTGIIMGTAAYMSPEQARGRAVDRRADIWAFGCLLYEMLSGSRPFAGDDTSMTLAAILKEDVNFTALPADTPPSIRRLMRRCLEKDPRKRLHSMADATLELDDAALDPAGPLAPARGWGSALIWGSAGALAAALVFGAILLARRNGPVDGAIVRSQIVFAGLPLRLSNFRTLAVNPAGTEVVFSAFRSTDQYQLFRRRLDGEEATPIAGTDGAMEPFFSPDGQWLAFFVQNGRLRRMPAAGGEAVDLAEVGGAQGASFAPDGSMIFNGQHGEGLWRVAAGDARPSPVTKVDDAAGQAGHHWPHVLPDGKHLLYTVELDGKPYSEAQIVISAIDGSDSRVLITAGSDARYIPTGHILYWREGSLWGVPFDLSTRQLNGTAVVILPDVMASEANGQAHYSISANGTLVYVPGRDTQQERSLMLVDRAGTAKPLTTERRAFETVAVAPDGRRLVVTLTAANDSLWTMELDRPSLTRITYEAENALPAWSPDGSRLALSRHKGGEPRQLFVMPSDGSTSPTRLHQSSRNESPFTWTGNGDVMAYVRTEAAGNDIWVVNMSGERKPRPLLATRFNENHPRFSPDGRWIAYASDESGRTEVYVRPFPGPGQKRLVSSDGGTEPRWRGDAREIYYRRGDAVLAVAVTQSPEWTVSVPTVLFKGPYGIDPLWSRWDVLPDGQRFVVVQDFAQPRTALHADPLGDS